MGHLYYLWQKYDSFTDSWIAVSSRALNDTLPYLNFTTVTEDDQGIYHCIVTNYDGSVASVNATIAVYGTLLYTIGIGGNINSMSWEWLSYTIIWYYHDIISVTALQAPKLWILDKYYKI